MSRGNLQGAVDIFTLLLAKAPNPIAFLNRGLAQERMGRYDKAIADYDRTIALAPLHATAYKGRGICLHAFKRYDEALVSYDKAIAIDPNDSGAYTNRGMTCMRSTAFRNRSRAVKRP
jgi:tetratricopeptide (TPR) repeat protein